MTNEIMHEVANDTASAAWSEFEAAVLARDLTGLRRRIRPDVEIYRNGNVLSIEGAFSKSLEQPGSEIVAALIGESPSVRGELLASSPEIEIRLLEGVGVGYVYKFREVEILKEIVLFPFGGLYRVYEIQFREAERSLPAKAER